ncbi:hypothetical protein HPB49_004266 [Dermacentor silvarum]|uniref:Uncharacterized protein n=1 Tax=Dermacentor silvarum TaxID=543639 RepID=A0ACB8CVP2_DERSI|nr:hypothetical protein HPB49_004266 [Dermacentor silvarum]
MPFRARKEKHFEPRYLEEKALYDSELRTDLRTLSTKNIRHFGILNVIANADVLTGMVAKLKKITAGILEKGPKFSFEPAPKRSELLALVRQVGQRVPEKLRERVVGDGVDCLQRTSLEWDHESSTFPPSVFPRTWETPHSQLPSLSMESQFKGRPTVGTGVRVIRMEMAKPVPNFMSIQGHCIMFDYRGIRKVCSRCGAEGHLGKTCETPRCERCEVYGPETAKCPSLCRRCAENHVVRRCSRRYNIPSSSEDKDGQPDEDELPKDFLNADRAPEVKTLPEGPRNSKRPETLSRSESSDSSEDEDSPPLPSSEESTTAVSASEADSSKTTSPPKHGSNHAADSAAREGVDANEPTDKPRIPVGRGHCP